MKTKLAPILLTAALLLPLRLTHGQTSQVPNRISYQGFVTEINGTPLGNGTPANHEVIFRLWDHPTNSAVGDLIYSEKQVVTIADGEFSVLIGAGADVSGEASKGPGSINVSDVFDGSQRYLGVTVAATPAPAGITGSDAEITPRQQLVSTAFTFRAKEAERVVDGAISETMLATGAVTSDIIASNTITAADLASNSVQTAELANGSVTGIKLAANAIDSSKIINGTITAADLASNSVQTTELANSAVTGIKLAANSIDGSKIANGTITADDIGAEAVGASELINSSITAAHLASNSVNTSELVNGAVSAAKIGSDVAVWTNSGGSAYRSSGDVGIGLASPDSPLHVQGTSTSPNQVGTSGSSGILIVEDASSRTIGIDGDEIQARSGNAAAPLYLNYEGSVVVVGNAQPFGARLIVGGSENLELFATAQGTNTWSSTNFTNTESLSIWTSAKIASTAYIVRSDERVKKVLGVSDGAEDLALLRGLEVTDYVHKDWIQKGKQTVKKVIAQQVESIYPQAVTQTSGVVPDIYQTASINDDWVELETDLSVGEHVRIVGETVSEVVEVLEVRDGAFRTTFDSGDKEVFVFGRRVDDFRSVDYDAISMLNVSATQELARRVEDKAEAAEVVALRAENAELKARLQKLEAKDQARDAKLAAIESLLRAAAKPALQTASLEVSAE